MREALIQVLAEVLAAEPAVAAAYVYGSAARSEATPLSDLDVALVLADECEAAARDELLRRLTVRLERALAGPRPDVRLLDEMPAAIAGRVVTEGVRVFESDPVARVRAEVRARTLYFDFLPVERLGTKEGLAALRRSYGVG